MNGSSVWWMSELESFLEMTVLNLRKMTGNDRNCQNETPNTIVVLAMGFSMVSSQRRNRLWSTAF